VACFKVPSQHLPGGAQKFHSSRNDRKSLNWDLKLVQPVLQT
jgi:hypothetical protein